MLLLFLNRRVSARNLSSELRSRLIFLFFAGCGLFVAPALKQWPGWRNSGNGSFIPRGSWVWSLSNLLFFRDHVLFGAARGVRSFARESL